MGTPPTPRFNRGRLFPREEFTSRKEREMKWKESLEKSWLGWNSLREITNMWRSSRAFFWFPELDLDDKVSEWKLGAGESAWVKICFFRQTSQKLFTFVQGHKMEKERNLFFCQNVIA